MQNQPAPVASKEPGKWEGALIALVCGSVILLFSLGIRHGFGLFLKPMSSDLGWGRETFAFAIALQNLVWGLSQPFIGLLADKYGAPKIAMLGALFYAGGLWIMSNVSDVILALIHTGKLIGLNPTYLNSISGPLGEGSFIFGSGLLIGLGLSGTTFPVIFGTINRLVKPEQRSMAMGITMSVGSFGQFIMLPISLGLLSWFDWDGALLVLSALALLMFPLAWGLKEPPVATYKVTGQNSPLEAIREALAMRDFWLLSLGFFACGFQVVFIAVHLPAFLADEGLDVSVATTVLALIGLLNIIGTYYAGFLGGKKRKPMLLSWLYLLRGLVIAGFIFMPISTYSAYAFGILMGLFWLSTVPLTNGTVASVWGVKHMSMLGGVVFFWHQLGSFIGGWLGGWLYDKTGSYDGVWYIAIGLSFLSAILNWPISETPAENRREKAPV